MKEDQRDDWLIHGGHYRDVLVARIRDPIHLSSSLYLSLLLLRERPIREKHKDRWMGSQSLKIDGMDHNKRDNGRHRERSVDVSLIMVPSIL